MKKLSLFALLLLHAGTFLMAQTTIVQWNFNSTFGSIPANGMAPAPSLGGGTINLIGGTTATSANGVIPTDGPAPGNQALNTSTYPPQGTSPKTAGIVINISTAGYNAVHLKYYVQHSGTAANKVIAQYYTGTTWQSVDSSITTTAGSFTLVDINFSMIPAVSNAANVQIRLVTNFGNSTSYQPVSSGTYGSSGTIRYDLVTITGNSLGCGTPATQQATGFRLLKTDNSLAQLTLNRGNGAGCLVLCSASGIPTNPVNSTNYAANSLYGSGTAAGNAFAVYNTQASNPATHYFNITGLTAGTKYYVAAYEYSSTGYCYLAPALVDSFYCNSTVLYPGDVQFVGYDNSAISGGDDAFAITNLKAITKGTSFQIANSRYEAGAPANTRTQRWYAGSGNPYSDLQTISILYTGTAPLNAGSIISFDYKAPTGYNVKINGTSSSLFSITSENVISGNSILSGSSAEQFFLTQGKFTSYGTTAANNQYSLLDGHVLHGISYIKNWVDFSQACSSGTTVNDRESRLPPDIKCLNLFFNAGGYAAYPTSLPHAGFQGYLLGQINAVTNWSNGLGSASANDISPIYNSPFNVTLSPATANWTGLKATTGSTVPTGKIYTYRIARQMLPFHLPPMQRQFK